MLGCAAIHLGGGPDAETAGLILSDIPVLNSVITTVHAPWLGGYNKWLPG
jgi:hypothetical protein